LGTQTEDAHLHALEVVDAIDFLAEPARGFGNCAAANNALDITFGVNLVVLLFATAIVKIREHFRPLGPEWDSREYGQRGILSVVVPGNSPTRVDRTVGDRIKAFGRRNKRTRLEHLELDAPTRYRLHLL